MSWIELFLIATGLSMDAFAVSICKGLAMKRCTLGKAGIVGLYFGGFQALMPLIGYFLGVQFRDVITSVDHWIAFILLGVIGGNMIREALGPEACETADASLDVRNMLALAVATSIDALAVGVTFAFLQVNIVPAVCFIGVITFTLSAAGVKIGNVFGTRFKAKAELAGGVILILIGAKILLEHLGILPW
ncbi:manganese efflux pump [Mordavella massiliensis]|jgi:putative Mn2+ efflux pump MntP|nr:manganese efflux pump [Mordavella massiliensis]HJB86863.1 manganese efflux pump MntP family protein [Candidatus Dorea faecigallinarum]